VFVALLWAALRRHPFSFSVSLVLGAAWTSILGTPVPIAALLWVGFALLALETWYALEPLALLQLGCREPSNIEVTRIQPALCRLSHLRLRVRVADLPEPWAEPALRSIVVTRGLLDLLEDRPLMAVLAQAAIEQRHARLVGAPLVWLACLPFVAGMSIERALMQVGRLLADVIGRALIVPALLWWSGFRRWLGTIIGCALVALVGSALISVGLPAFGLALLLGWLVARAVSSLVGWETRRAEFRADAQTIDEGLGPDLLDALESLEEADRPKSSAGVGLTSLLRGGAPHRDRARRLRRLLYGSTPTN
jgi:Zn-dependent protease with chaperone function